MDNLKPCPFCGGEANYNNMANHNGKPMWWIICLSCKASTNWHTTKEKVEKAWNQREEATVNES